MWETLEILDVFNTLILKQVFWKTKTFFKKTGVPFLVESTKIENATFSKKTAPSEPSAKTNRKGSTKWTYHKELSFVRNYFIFLNICFQLRPSYKKLIWCANYPNVHIHTFPKRWSFKEGAFSLWKKRIWSYLLRIWSYLLKKSWMEMFICAVYLH